MAPVFLNGTVTPSVCVFACTYTLPPAELWPDADRKRFSPESYALQRLLERAIVLSQRRLTNASRFDSISQRLCCIFTEEVFVTAARCCHGEMRGDAPGLRAGARGWVR